LEFGEELILEDLIEVEVDTLLSDSLHQVGSKPLVEAANSFLPPSGACQVPESLVLLSARAADELALLDPRPEGGDGVGEQARKDLAETAADEVLFRNGRFRDFQLLIQDFGALVDIHLDDS
jgi:hypothetical protein